MRMMKLLATVSMATVALSAMTACAQEGEFVGRQLPELKVKYLGEAPTLAGKPAIIEFWATWCPPCRASIPHLNELYAKYRDRGLVIVGITNEDRPTVEKFLKGLPIKYAVAFDEGGKMGEYFRVRGIPHAFLVNADGKIVWQGHPMALREAEIEKVLPAAK